MAQENKAPQFTGPVAPPQGAPAWWVQRQAEAWELFKRLPAPSRKDEDWRFANLSSLGSLGVAPSAPIAPEQIREFASRSKVSFGHSGQWIFVNDRPCASSLEGLERYLRRGLIVKPLMDALLEHSDLLQAHFMALPVGLGSDKFAALHASQVTAGLFVYVPKGLKVEDPVLVNHWMTGDGAVLFPHTLVVAEEGSEVTVVDIGRADGDPQGVVVACNDVVCGQGAKVRYVNKQNWGERALALHLGSTNVGADASVVGLQVNMGSAFLRTENRSRLAGRGARSEMLSLSVLHGNQEFDQRTFQHHCASDTWSDLLYKNSLNHKAKSIFQGMIRVEPEGQRTDAYQTNRNLLLSAAAEADSMPGLEILNDDVKCSHGATAGQVDEELLFYMRARGIPPQEAKHLLVMGFFEEVLERFGRGPIVEHIEAMLEEKFNRSLALDSVSLEEIPDAETGDPTDVRNLQGTE
jgi:Fe-S cluster assembly protein SufD